MMVAETLRRNRKITITTRADGEHQLELHVAHGGADGIGAVGQDLDVNRFRQRQRRSCGSKVLMRSTTEMMLAPGCRWMFMMTAGVSFIQAA